MKTLAFLIILLCALSFNVLSQNVTEIPLPEEFVTTMDVAGEYPMVRTGYLTDSISDIARFYQQKLGEPLKTNGNNTYRTLFYNYQEHKVRISLYRRSYVTEVSIMVE
ncbi:MULTISPECIES: hypothetical protein [unclassified Pseudoalteromonas]|uniref:hypothetical protein n=1 Tax=unclassified Pseudoalteromonas TaxID=194690 RepID=UPI001601A563|nr:MULTISPECIES: hypothetical protein [unclassified Pseudoalteromonas]MBB1280273.1 hypothetical protein [Pseudoalteromonas sp. SR41-1]MBB1443326.1 hypothetical protein [Pseudoalteromonas sp. SG43-3]